MARLGYARLRFTSMSSQYGTVPYHTAIIHTYIHSVMYLTWSYIVRSSGYWSGNRTFIPVGPTIGHVVKHQSESCYIYAFYNAICAIASFQSDSGIFSPVGYLQPSRIDPCRVIVQLSSLKSRSLHAVAMYALVP